MSAPAYHTDEQGFRFNDQQIDAVREIMDFLESPGGGFYGLYGYAGTGKTTTIHEALDHPHAGRIAMSAPTHKAVGVLASMDSHLDGVEFSTIHRLLSCRKQYRDGEIFFEPDPGEEQPICEFDTVVIDECSMIGETMWGWIQEAVHGEQIKVIVMGDPLQLPPVKDGDASPTFELGCSRLTRIMRHQGVIEQAASAVRESLEDEGGELPLAANAQDEHGEIINLQQGEFLESLMNNLADAKVLAYTNAAVDWVNDYIRRKLFGEDAAPFEIGERLVLVTTYDGDGTLLHTETELMVEDTEPSKHLGLECWRLQCRGTHGGQYEIHALADAQKRPYFRALANAKDRGKAGGGWKPYYALKEGFADVRPGWATTIHKSQGSTYEHVYLIQTNVLSTAGHDPALAKMLLYVGYSRASSRLILS